MNVWTGEALKTQIQLQNFTPGFSFCGSVWVCCAPSEDTEVQQCSSPGLVSLLGDHAQPLSSNDQFQDVFEDGNLSWVAGQTTQIVKMTQVRWVEDMLSVLGYRAKIHSCARTSWSPRVCFSCNVRWWSNLTSCFLGENSILKQEDPVLQDCPAWPRMSAAEAMGIWGVFPNNSRTSKKAPNSYICLTETSPNCTRKEAGP